MTEAEFKIEVQTVFPIKFNETLIYEEDGNEDTIDRILQRAVKRAISKYEKIEKTNVVGTTSLPDAVSILKCVPDDAESSNINAISLMLYKKRDLYRLAYTFGPDRILKIAPEGSSAYIEYLVDTENMSIEDLNDVYIQWAIDYAVALLKMKEGGIGKLAKITDLPFEFDYEGMYSEGSDAKTTLEDTLDNEMYSGVISIMSN